MVSVGRGIPPRAGRGGRPIRVGEHGGAAVDEVLEEGDAGRFAEGHHALPAALAEHQDGVGRPVDVLQLKDGSLLVSDDWNGAVYRITYGKPKVAAKQ